jgi:hypothetical protein
MEILKRPAPQIVQMGELHQKFSTIMPSIMGPHSVAADKVVYIFSPEFIKSIDFETHENKINFFASVDGKRHEIPSAFFVFLKDQICPKTKDSVFIISDKSLVEQTMVTWVLNNKRKVQLEN